MPPIACSLCSHQRFLKDWGQSKAVCFAQVDENQTALVFIRRRPTSGLRSLDDKCVVYLSRSPGGGIGRRDRLKIYCWQQHESSILSLGTKIKFIFALVINRNFFLLIFICVKINLCPTYIPIQFSGLIPTK